MPGTLWKLLATALPVSPEVAARIILSLSDSLAIEANTPAMNLAPTSLKARVGPWNSSRTLKSLPRFFNSISKSNALSIMLFSSV
ncbi:hypothetical protein SDC9_93966 [bioreactor metagenome]|uniref:Uncharacterized protein n=1 Tax=bioreactor metagenome TaxID=1076179 RepID=A0A645A3G6_9ZZZZ